MKINNSELIIHNSKVPVLRFPEFSGELESKKINEITSYVDYRGKTPEKSDSGIFLITARNIREGYIDYECSKEYIPLETYEEVMRRGKPLIGDILITTEAPCGNIASIDKEGIALAQRVIKFRGKENIYNYFLKFYFLSDFFQKKLFEKATGGTVKGIKGSQLHKMIVKFPTFPEQQKIADFLTQIDNKINQLSQKKQLLERYKKGVMQRIMNYEFIINNPAFRFTDDDGREFPEWEEKSLGEMATFNNGRAYKQTEWETSGIPVIRLQNLTGSGNDYYYSTLDLPANQYCEKGDLLYMWSATFGAIWWFGDKAIYHYHIWKIDTTANLSKNYFFYVLNDITAKMKNKSNGSTMLHITKGGIEKLKATFPCIEEQTKIANFLTALDEKIALVEKQLHGTKQYKKGLLQQLFV